MTTVIDAGVACGPRQAFALPVTANARLGGAQWERRVERL